MSPLIDCPMHSRKLEITYIQTTRDSAAYIFVYAHEGTHALKKEGTDFRVGGLGGC